MKAWHHLALLSLAALPFSAHGETYTCVSFEYPPLIYKGADGHTEGLAVDIVSHVLRKLGHAVHIELYPWGRALALAKQGETDCIFTLYHSPERELFLDYSNEAIVPQIIYLYARKGVTVSFDGDLSSIKGFHVGTAHKVNYGPKFEEARPRLVIDEAATIEQNFRKLAMGRVDLVPSNLYTALSTLTSPSLRKYADHIVRLPTPLETVLSHIAFPKARKHMALRDSFDAEFRKFVASGEYRRLLAQYGLDHIQEVTRLTQAR
jgi:polar amino acid transport system substrate-binding protein